MKTNSQIAIVIPVYNEGSVLSQTIHQLRIYHSSVDFDFDIILVDDGSTDNGISELQNSDNLQITILRHDENLGQGAALATGLDYVRKVGYEIMIHFDADGQHPSEAIGQLVQPLFNNEVQVVLGSRFLTKESLKLIPLKRRLLLKLALLVDNWISGVKKTDVHNGLRAFNYIAINRINIKAKRMEHASEIIWEIKRHGLAFIEIPVKIKYTEYSMSKEKPLSNALKVFLNMLFYYWNYRRNNI